MKERGEKKEGCRPGDAFALSQVDVSPQWSPHSWDALSQLQEGTTARLPEPP